MIHWKLPLYVGGAMATCVAGGVTANMDSISLYRLALMTFAAAATATVAYFDQTAAKAKENDP